MTTSIRCDEATALPAGACAIGLAGARLAALPSGALWWPGAGLLAVGDLHLGRPQRTARSGAGLIPPYGDRDTLDRLDADLAATRAARVVCVGDSFDCAVSAAEVAPALSRRIGELAAGRDWLWIAGNHDPRAPALPGRWAAEAAIGPLVFRHAARAEAVPGEVSAHYHPKAVLRHRGRRIARRCFLWDARRLILPAYGTYTGGLDARDSALAQLLAREAQAGLTGPRVTALPVAALG